MKTKIIATIGPSSVSMEKLKQMKKNGMDIARINMKYSEKKEYMSLIKKLKKIKCKILFDVKTEDHILAIKDLNFDYVALAFTRNAEDVKKVRKIIGKKIFIISKIEDKKGLQNIDEIIKETDGVMVARGDLGKCVKIAELPSFQKMIIKKCNKKGKFVVTATEMLLSMVNSKFPTKAEVSDVANAFLDGSNAVMLSEETSIGNYPHLAVSMMHEILAETNKNKHIFS